MRKKITPLLMIMFFLLVNIVFNFNLWNSFFTNKLNMNDNVITEFLVETSYENILNIKNIFTTKAFFYPFTTNFSLSDPAISNIVFFLFLRPLFNPQRILMIVTLGTFLINNTVMYLLLRKLKIKQNTAILISLVFGFTPFLSHRIISHYTYIPIYFFPLTYLIINQFFEAKLTKIKFLFSIIFGLFLAFVLLSNFYYFLMIVLGLLFFLGYFFITNNKKIFKFISFNFKYLVVSSIFFNLCLIPWFISISQLYKNHKLISDINFGSAITLSADVFSFFTPSEYNPIYKKIFSFFSLHIPYFAKYNTFFLNSWERFAYPGIIILGTYFLIFLLKILKKFSSLLWNKIKPFFIVSVLFAILMLGPFLKIFNRWFVNLDGVAVIFPLPSLLFHYIPGLSSLRVTSRFTPIFVFFASIVVANIIDFVLNKINKKKQTIFIISLFLIFFIDQFYVIPTKLNQEIPEKIYNNLKNKPQGTVLEVPFTVRDGFQYMGDVHAIQPMVGQIIHKKPIIGGYMARVPNEIFDYYKNLKFINYLAETIDRGNNPFLKENFNKVNFYPYPYSLNTISNEVQSLNIKYIVLKKDEKYSEYLLSLLKKVGFIEKQKDSNYLFLEK